MPPRPPKPPATVTAVLDNPFGASTDIPDVGSFMMIYAPPGEGKTSLAGQFDKPLFVITSGEQGIYHLKKSGVVSSDIPVVQLDPLYDEDNIPANTGHPGYFRLIEVLNTFVNGSHDRKTLVIDTASGLIALLMQHCASVHYDGDMKSRDRGSWNDYYAGPRKTATTYLQSSVIRLCLEAKMKGLNVVLLAHCKSKDQTNYEGKNYEMMQPEMDNTFWTVLQKDLSDILFLGKHHNVRIDEKTKDVRVSSVTRFVGVTSSEWYFAKNWENRREEIEAGSTPQETFSNMRKVMSL